MVDSATASGRCCHRSSSSSKVDASGTTLRDLFGVGPIVAAVILGHVGDPARFSTPERFASCNGPYSLAGVSRVS
jgi:transposase